LSASVVKHANITSFVAYHSTIVVNCCRTAEARIEQRAEQDISARQGLLHRLNSNRALATEIPFDWGCGRTIFHSPDLDMANPKSDEIGTEPYHAMDV
jgi:hypothetical protein